MQTLTIIDTACANLSSVKFAVERLGYQARITANPQDILSAEKLLLPGVGAAKAAVAKLEEKQLFEVIGQVTQPLLGICLGMQLLTTSSEEGNVEVLGIMPARTQKFPDCGLPLPHMGWNSVKFSQNEPLFADIVQGAYFYFVHSYAVLPNEYTIATCDYGVPFSAALQKGNFYGVQFHPERSGKVGAQLLRNFMENI